MMNIFKWKYKVHCNSLNSVLNNATPEILFYI